MIVSAGEALVDLVPHPVPGGGPMNVAVAAARLGNKAAFLGRVSTDEHGENIWRYLLENGVDLTLAQRGPEPTARAIVEHTPKLVFRFEGDATADTNLTAADLTSANEPVILHGGTLGLFRGQTAETLAELVERHEGLVSLDPNVRPQIIDDRGRWDHFHARWSARADIYRGSDEDFAWIWPGRDPSACAEELVASGTTVVIITRGGEGASLFTAAGQLDVGGRPVEVVDTVGAGDTFVAATLVQLDELGLAGQRQALGELSVDQWRTIASTAGVASSITVSRLGADPPTKAELLAALES